MTNKAPISKEALYATLCREFEFLTMLFSQQYSLRDLCDTIG